MLDLTGTGCAFLVFFISEFFHVPAILPMMALLLASFLRGIWVETIAGLICGMLYSTLDNNNSTTNQGSVEKVSVYLFAFEIAFCLLAPHNLAFMGLAIFWGHWPLAVFAGVEHYYPHAIRTQIGIACALALIVYPWIIGQEKKSKKQ